MIRSTLPITLLLSACVAADEPALDEPETASVSAALACTTYTVTDLGIPAGGGSSSATSLDDSGHVAGTYRPTTVAEPLHAFTWSAAGGFVDLGTLGGTNSFGYGVSGARIVGESNIASGDSHAFLRDGSGMHDLGTLGGGGIDASRARGVNASGVAVGESRLANGFQHAARYQGGSATDLGTLVGTPTSNSIAFAINASGVVVGASDTATGSHAAKWANGTIVDLGTIGTASSVANAVNANGDAAGNLVTSFVPRPAKFVGGTVVDLGLLPGFERATGSGINNAGFVVGTAQHTNGEAPSTVHCFLHDGTGLTDLNSVVVGQGWLITNANAINTAGQIAGAGVSTAGGMGADTRTHALVLTPSCVAATPAFRSVATTTNGTTVARPAGTVAGDFLLAALEYDADPLVITPPAGWSLVADQRAGAGTAQVFHGLVYAHVAGASEPTSYNFASPAGVYVDVQVAAYRNVTAVDVVGKAQATAASIAAPSVTTTGANRMLVAIYIDFAGGTWTTASGMTKRSSFDSNSLQDQLRPTAGATGVRTASNASGAMTAFSVALK